jgi:uncharacterized protein YndB with AHSA1/START domain
MFLQGEESPMTQTADVAERSIVSTRFYSVSPTRLFDAWTDPVQLAKWFGPFGVTTTTHEIDVRPGGVWRFTMRAADGAEFHNKVVYREVSRPTRLVYDQVGEVEGALTFQVTVTFEEKPGGTQLTMEMLFGSPDERAQIAAYGVEKGNVQTFHRLAQMLGSL